MPKFKTKITVKKREQSSCKLLGIVPVPGCMVFSVALLMSAEGRTFYDKLDGAQTVSTATTKTIYILN